MQLNITARHIDLTPALSDYVHRKVEKAQRYFDSIVWAQAIVAVEKHRQTAELVVHTPGSTFRTIGEAGDLYSAIDLAVHKLDLHLSKAKDKQRARRKGRSGRTLSIRTAPPPADLIAAETPGNGAITEINRVSLHSYTVPQAVRELHSNRLPFFVFVNDRTSHINVVYRKGKEEVGLVEAFGES